VCGINAVFDPLNQVAEKARALAAMNAEMRYRGPDDEGTWLSPEMVLGMRRLSIIDVAGGNQPQTNEDGSVVLVFNGEIYNYLELVPRLEALGHSFRTLSDTEVIIHSYEEFGLDCLNEFRGMFAFVLWDSRRQRLFAARDRIGIKPLYFAQHNGALWLSSELKSIAVGAKMSPDVRPSALCQFLLYSYPIDQRHTIVKQIDRVLPGEYLLADGDGVQQVRYWQPEFGVPESESSPSDADIFDELSEAVRIHLRSDVPLALLLSGGIDSSAIAALASRSRVDFTALCAGYEGDHEMDERKVAHQTAMQLGMRWQDAELDPDAYETCFDQLARVCDEPIGDPAAPPQWMLYQQAAQYGYKVVLTGLGGDELFFGYPGWNRAVLPRKGLYSNEAWRSYLPMVGDPSARLVRAGLRKMAGPALMEADRHADTPIHDLLAGVARAPDAVSRILFAFYLVGNGCQLADKLGMGCSVEVRVPFLDHRLVERVFSMPSSRRFDPLVSKPLLRRILRGHLSDQLLTAPKRGFEPPAGFELALSSHRLEQVLDGKLVSGKWISRSAVRRLWDVGNVLPHLHSFRVRQHLGIRRPGTLFFRLLAVEAWWQMMEEKTSARMQ
jgi:asparagine synthase (glutamine-hydrolysing)